MNEKRQFRRAQCRAMVMCVCVCVFMQEVLKKSLRCRNMTAKSETSPLCSFLIAYARLCVCVRVCVCVCVCVQRSARRWKRDDRVGV